MTKHEIISKVKALNLPEGSYIVFGSCPMAAAGLREANDIDMMVTPELLERFKQAGWQKVDKGKNDNPYAFEDFEAHTNWDFSSYSPTLQQLLSTADVYDGVPFASLVEVRKWKAASGRLKDFKDIQLIDAHLTRQA